MYILAPTYIIVNNDATRTTDITNSELAFLGYESGYGGSDLDTEAVMAVW